ncbi:hypothetical protein FRX31_033647 [Thalictrum thalictroides]|uniref:Uncharacterized protein n=1 Tax=Thalictrum thalictroides TaxID=46969 RepID=A0A7J6UX16_THATH|nr:hypothetical protein FRX31_033647 [Thalictrum thalictroides]
MDLGYERLYNKGDWVRLGGTSRYYYYIGYDVQLNEKRRYLDFHQKIPSASVFPHSESLLSCSILIAEPCTEMRKRRKLH